MGAGGALAMLAVSMGMQPRIAPEPVADVPLAPALSARSIERAPLVRIRDRDGIGHFCTNHTDPNIPCAMFAPGYKPTVPNEDTPDPDNAGEFVVSGQKWPQPGGLGTTVSISYSYSNLLNGGMSGISSSQLQNAVQEALNVWAAQAPLSFTLVSDSGPLPTAADTSYPAGSTPNLRFGHHTFDGPSNVLAHAYFPNPGSGLAGDLHFDNGESWATAPASGKIDFLEVCVHEIGHTLGLNHEPSPPAGQNAIMNPFYGARFSGPGTAFLLTDDKNGIKNIYGTSSGCSVQAIIERAKLLPFAKGLKLSSATNAERFYADLTEYSARVLQATPAGQQLAATYKKHGPEVVAALVKRPELIMQAVETFTALQEPMARHNARDEVLHLPTATYTRLMDFLKALDGTVSEDAQAAITSAREVLETAHTVDGDTVSIDFRTVR